MTYRRTKHVGLAALAAICVATMMALGSAASATSTHRTPSPSSTVKQQMLHDLVAEGWKQERIFRIDVKNKLATFLIGSFECPLTFPLIRTKSGTGYLYWWPYLRGVNDGSIFPFPPSAVSGLGNYCQP